MMQTIIEQARQKVLEHANGFHAKIGIITGSGLSEIADAMTETQVIPYQAIPGVQSGQVLGHASRLVMGKLAGVPVVCLKGRLHAYEGASYQSMQVLVNLVKALGCESVLITNASGSLREEVGPGEIVVINDHINFSFASPLMGPNDESVGPRFLSMTKTYDPYMQDALFECAKRLGFALHRGVYIGTAGPMFETPAEIRAFRLLGADVVGMSTIPDVILARHCGMRLAVISAITNYAAGITGEELSHEETLAQAKKLGKRMLSLVSDYVKTQVEDY
jgi:xanthosine phosphorylase